MSLLFAPGNHTYWMSRKPDETRRTHVPGVTGLIKKGLPAPALVYWSAKAVAEWVADHEDDLARMRTSMGRAPLVGALKEVPWQARDEAAIRGTDVHAIAERIVHGESVDVPDHLLPYVQGYTEWLDAFDVQPEFTERSLGNRRWWYAGRADFRGTIAGRRCSADWKTAKGVYGDNALQLAAYDNCEFAVEDGDPDTETVIEPTGSLAVVHVAPYETRHHWVKNPDDAWRWFQHVAYTGRNSKAIDDCLGPAIDLPDTDTHTEESEVA